MLVAQRTPTLVATIMPLSSIPLASKRAGAVTIHVLIDTTTPCFFDISHSRSHTILSGPLRCNATRATIAAKRARSSPSLARIGQVGSQISLSFVLFLSPATTTRPWHAAPSLVRTASRASIQRFSLRRMTPAQGQARCAAAGANTEMAAWCC